MTKFVVIDWNMNEVAGEGTTVQKAVDSVDIHANDFIDSLEADQVGIYQELSGDIQLGGLKFVSSIPRK